MIKQLVAVRRRAGMTRQEFFNYHYQIHGSLSTGPNPSETPLKYFQTHFIDTAYHADISQTAPNAHPAWAFSEDITELYFSSPEHMSQVFASEWVKQKVGPDGANFSDFSAVVPMLVREEAVSLAGSDPSFDGHQKNAFVAMYFVALRGQSIDVADLNSRFMSLLSEHMAQDVLDVTVNIPAEAGFDLGAYFGRNDALPRYHVFTVRLRGKQSISAVREAQALFEEQCADMIDLPATWIGFGERAVVFDQTQGIEFDPSRQPYKVV